MPRKWKDTSKALGEHSLSDFATADFVLPSLMACPTVSGMHLPRQLIQWRCISSRWKTGVSTYLRTWDDIIPKHSNTNTLTFEPLMSKCQYQLQFNVWSSGPTTDGFPSAGRTWVPRLWMPFVPGSLMASGLTACALVVNSKICLSLDIAYSLFLITYLHLVSILRSFQDPHFLLKQSLPNDLLVQGYLNHLSHFRLSYHLTGFWTWHFGSWAPVETDDMRIPMLHQNEILIWDDTQHSGNHIRIHAMTRINFSVWQRGENITCLFHIRLVPFGSFAR